MFFMKPYDHEYWDALPLEKWVAYLNYEEAHRLWLAIEKQPGGILSDSFHVSTYPELVEIFSEKFQEIDRDLRQVRKTRNQLESVKVEGIYSENELRRMSLTNLASDMERALNKSWHHFRGLSGAKNTPTSNGISQSAIQEARTYPIENLFNGNLRKNGARRLSGLCPFHSEKTPSFVIYKDSNTFHCFGCGERGDAITFYMKQYETDFRTAVIELTGGSHE